jgi:hypothetical protein
LPNVRSETSASAVMSSTVTFSRPRSTATSFVKTYARGRGSTYPGMPWEPKQAFGAVASFYAAC